MVKRYPDDDLVEYICDQLEELDGVAHRPMFGGFGLYCGSTFFGILFRGHLYFKTSDASREKYIEWGSEPFQPNAKQRLKAYYEVPAELIDDAPQLALLANEAIDIAAATRD